MKKGTKSGLLKNFWTHLEFFTKTSPRNSWSPHSMIPAFHVPHISWLLFGTKITKCGDSLYMILTNNYYIPPQKSPQNPSLHVPHFPEITSHTFPARLFWHAHSMDRKWTWSYLTYFLCIKVTQDMRNSLFRVLLTLNFIPFSEDSPKNPSLTCLFHTFLKLRLHKICD